MSEDKCPQGRGRVRHDAFGDQGMVEEDIWKETYRVVRFWFKELRVEHSAEAFGEVMDELYEVLEYTVRKHVLEADDLALPGYNFSFS